MAKALGIEIKKFVNEGFPDWGYYEPDEGDYSLDELEDNTRYDLADLGYIVSHDGEKSLKFSSAFSRWKKSQSFSYLLVEVPIGKEEELKSMVKTLGCKIV